MLTWIRRLLSPPVFEGDDDKTRAAWLLNIILLTLLARAVFIRIITWSQPPRPSFFVPLTLLLLAMIFLMRRGAVRLASAITVIGFWLSLTAVAVISGGIHSTGFRNYILPVLIAGLLLGRGAAMATAGLSILASLVMWVAEINGVIAVPPGSTASLELLITHAISLLMAAVLVTLATRHIEEALERARREIVERRQTEETLRLSEERFAKMFQASPESASVYRHRDGVLLEVNQRWTSVFGYTREEAIGHTALELNLVTPEYRQRLRRLLEEQGSIHEFEAEFKNKRGEARHVILSVEQIVIQGELCISYFHRDITERKQAEAALHESEEVFRTLAETVSSGIFIHQNMRYVYVNPAAERLTGYTRDELLKMHLLDLIHPDFHELIKARVAARERGEWVPSPAEDKILTKSGETRWMEVTAGKIKFRGQSATIVTTFDITERKRAEEALRASEERFSKAFNLSPIRMGIARIKDGVILDVNDCWVREMGFTREETVGQPILELKAWIGQEAPRIRQLLQDGQAVRNWEGQANTKAGEKRIVLTSVEVIELSGEPCLLWAANDITERKRAEEALRESEELFRTSFENATAGVCLVGTDRRFLSVNHTLCEMLGYTKQELEQLSFNDITHGEDKHIGATFVAQALSGGASSAHFEKRYIHQDGHAIWAYVSTALVRQPGGKPRYFISYIQDITERKRAETERLCLMHDLGERIKELTALHRTARLLQAERPFDQELLSELVAGLPPAWQYPEVCEAQITYADLEVRTPGWRETPWQQTAQFTTSDGQHGTIEVVYLEERPPAVEGPFLAEERHLIRSLADMLTAHLERQRAEQALLESNAKLLLAMDMAKLGHWEYDVATECFTFDENFYKLYGTTPTQEGGTLMSAADYARKFIPPAEAAIVAEEIGKSLTTTDPDFTRQIEHRIMRADGSPGHMLVRYALIKDAQGRTVKTYGANQDITERKQAEEQIKATSEQLRALMASLRSAREEEGIRIAREIHDELGSALTSLRWDLEEIDKSASEAEDQALLPALRGKISAMFGLIDATIHVVRRISSELRPSILDDLGLAAAVEWQAQQFQARTGIICRYDCAVENLDLDPEQSTAVFRIFQEALTNVLRHAQATSIDVALEKEGTEFVLRISDNGRGISDEEKTGQFSLGLLGMRERAHLIGAQIEITGIEGKGTTVTLRVPHFRSQSAVATV